MKIIHQHILFIQRFLLSARSRNMKSSLHGARFLAQRGELLSPACTSTFTSPSPPPPPPHTKKKRIHVDYRRAVLFASLVLLRDFVFLYNFIFFPFPFLRLQIEAIYGTQSIPDGQKERNTVACREGRTGVFSLCMIVPSDYLVKSSHISYNSLM